MKKVKLIVGVFLFLLFCSTANAQEDFSEIIKTFKNYRVNEVQEKIYVHLSQKFLLTGELLWFKVYDVDATEHKLLTLSKVAYIELSNAQGESVLQCKIEMKDGEGNGSLFLPATLPTGNYHFKAYTRWMQNFDASYYFHSIVSIVNPFRQLDQEEHVEQNYTIDFFPEGGNMVTGVRNKVAFKVTDQFGIGRTMSGRIVNKSGETVVLLKTFKFGMGSFEFEPLPEEKYRVLLEGDNSELIVKELPDLKLTGFVIRTETKRNELNIVLETTPDNGGSAVYLLIHSRNRISWAEIRIIENQKARFQIPLSALHAGISHITLFDAKRRPVCERLFFNREIEETSKLVVQAEPKYGKRKLIKLNVRGMFSSNEVAKLSVSVSRIDEPAYQGINAIDQYLELTSELQGRIESPDYYFSNDVDVDEALDNLMLTQGWRRFKWDSILDKSSKSVRLAPELFGHIISGQSVSRQDDKPLLAFLSSPDKSAQFYEAKSKEDGKLKFNVYDFYGSIKLIFQLANGQSLKSFELDNPFSAKSDDYLVAPLVLNPAQEAMLVNKSKDMQIQDIYHSSVDPEIKDKSVFYGSSGKTYMLDDYVRFPVMEEVMREYVAEVIVRRKDKKFVFKIWDDAHETVFENEPLILLDGVPVLDTDEIMNYDPKYVKRLDVFTRKFYLGDFSYDGLVSYITYKGETEGFRLNAGAIVLDYEGLQLRREFFSPQYQKAGPDRNPDNRHLLYWNPNLHMGKPENGIEFYSSEVPGTYQVEVEGISNLGRAYSGTAIFYVE